MRKMEKSLNKKALRLLMVVSVVSGILIVLLFYIMEMNHIRQRAMRVLKEQRKAAWENSGQFFPEIYFIPTDETEDFLLDGERELLQYYRRSREKISKGEIYYFSEKGCSVWFYVIAAGRVGQETGEETIVFADMTFSVEMVRTAASILAAVAAVISVLIYLLGRHTVRVLDAKDKSVKDFFSNASHELKTPLMAIRGYAEAVQDGIAGNEKACSIIVKETERMSSLVNTILEFSKLDSGVINPHMERNDVREILYDAIQAVEPAAAQRGITITFHLPDPIFLDCDEDMLFSVFSNILTNGVRYARSSLSLLAEYSVGAAGLKVSIVNDGPPISKEDAAHIFDRFYRGSGGQTGIGMALSLEYMRLHGGDVRVIPQENGTVFEIVF